MGLILLFNAEIADDEGSDKKQQPTRRHSAKLYSKNRDRGKTDDDQILLLKAMQATKLCLMEQIKASNSDNFWNKSTEIINSCGATNDLNIIGFENDDETKFHIPSKFQDSDCSIVTLGVGMDTTAEQKMAKLMPNCRFYGADPNSQTNKELYEKIGFFYNTAVGSKNGFFNHTVLDTSYKGRDLIFRIAVFFGIPIYTERSVSTREFFEFIQEDLKLKVVDQILIDIEKAEYELVHNLLKKNAPSDVVFCQINIEFHPHTENTRNIYYNFLRDLVEEGYILPLKATVFEPLNMKRLYFLNTGDKICQDRYFYPRPQQ